MVVFEKEKKVGIIRLNDGKVNALSYQMIRSIKEVVEQAYEDESVGGLILTGRPGAFSAGLDVMEQAQMDAEEAHQFWVTYFQMLQAMVRYPKPFVCAISGFAPAGATPLTLCADYRIMSNDSKCVIGLHEFKLSMQIPELMIDLWSYALGEAKAFQLIQTATLLNANEALEANLIQEIGSPETVLDLAKKHMNKCLQVEPSVYIESKRLARKQLLQLVDRDMEKMASDFVAFTNTPALKARVTAFAEKLKQKN